MTTFKSTLYKNYFKGVANSNLNGLVVHYYEMYDITPLDVSDPKIFDIKTKYDFMGFRLKDVKRIAVCKDRISLG